MRSKNLIAIFGITLSLLISGCVSNSPEPTPSPQKTVVVQKKETVPENNRDLKPLPKNTKTIRSFSPKKKTVYLTFDDGPHPSYTLKIAEILKQENVKGTFFSVGSIVKTWSKTFKKLAKYDNVSLQIHSWNHDDYVLKTNSFIENDLKKTLKVFHSNGVYPKFFRPPYGAINNRTKNLVLKTGLKNVLWTVDAEDWRKPGVSKIVKTVLKNVRPGYIVLLYDGGGNRSQTVKALPIIIKKLKQKGYSFEVIS